MHTDESTDGTSEPLTEASLASVFEGFLSDDPEYQDSSETPPTQAQSPESEPESAEVESSTEQDQAEPGESEATEQTEESQTETSPETLDPNLKVRVKVAGEDLEITLAEALRGYSRTEDYTRKTQELSTQRRQAEELTNALRVDREQYAYQLTELAQNLKDAQPKEPDWVKLQQENPEAFPGEWARWSQYKDQMSQLEQERQRATEAVMKDRAEAETAYLREQQEKLLTAIPEWKDAAKAKAEKAKMVAAAESYGYTQDDLKQVRDHRIMQVLRDAMRYRELQKNKPAITEVIHKVKTATPGSGTSRTVKTKATAAKERLRNSGSLDDLAAVFTETVLADME